MLLGVPPFLVGLPSGGDSLDLFDDGAAVRLPLARPGSGRKRRRSCRALSEWLLPRGVRVEVNRDEYVQPGPYERAQTDQILAAIVDPATGQPAKSVAEIRETERFTDSAPELAEGVLR